MPIDDKVKAMLLGKTLSTSITPTGKTRGCPQIPQSQSISKQNDTAPREWWSAVSQWKIPPPTALLIVRRQTSGN